MKALLLLALVIGLGAGVNRTPKDLAANGNDAPMRKAPALPPVPAPAGVMVTPLLVTRPTNLPHRVFPTNNGMAMSFVAAPGPHGYLLCWSTNLNKPWTNVVREYPADGKTNTETVLYETNRPQVYFGLFQF